MGIQTRSGSRDRSDPDVAIKAHRPRPSQRRSSVTSSARRELETKLTRHCDCVDVGLANGLATRWQLLDSTHHPVCGAIETTQNATKTMPNATKNVTGRKIGLVLLSIPFFDNIRLLVGLPANAKHRRTWKSGRAYIQNVLSVSGTLKYADSGTA